MLEHVSLGVKNVERSKALYIEALAPLGYKMNMDFGEAAGFMEGGHTSLWIVQKQRTIPSHVAFRARNMKAVEAFHKAALKAGATDNGAPGFRTDYGDDYYAAFVLDLDGNNIEACYFGATAPKAKKTNKKKTR